MALFRLNPKFSSKFLPNFVVLNKQFLRSWFRKRACVPEKESAVAVSQKNVVYQNSCRKFLPPCPEHISTGAPSRCTEEGYGKPIKSKCSSWFSLRGPVAVKEKPSNCIPPACRNRETLKEYLFGPKKPLPHANTCRLSYKYKQMCSANDPRLKDPRFEATKGDVLIYTEPTKTKICGIKGPQPKGPPLHIPPTAVVCKRISDTLSSQHCYCACAPLKDESHCTPNLCPVHSKPFKFPYEEMKPRNRKMKLFTCEQGISSEDVTSPPRSDACTCLALKCCHSSETCDLHEMLKVRKEKINTLQCQTEDIRRLSKSEKLKSVTRPYRKLGIAACQPGCSCSRAL